MPVPSSARRARRGVIAALTMTAMLSSCGSPQVLEPEEAETHYDEVIGDVQDVLGELDYELVHAPATRSLEVHDGTCKYTPGNYQADGLSAALGDEAAWGPVLDALNPVLDEHGFDTRDEPSLEGGSLRVTVEDDYGAELSIGDMGHVRIWGAHVSDTACADG